MKYNLELLRPYKRSSWPLDNFFEEFFAPASAKDSNLNAQSFVPVCDIREDAENFYLQADLPGISKDDVKVEYNDGLLTIAGERKHESVRDEKDFHLREASYGSFSRVFRLGDVVDTEKIEARFENGVLKLTLPKIERKKAQPIKIY